MATNVQANLLLNTAPAQASFNNFARAIGSAKFAQPLGRITGDATEFRKSLEAATARVTAFGLTAGAIYKVSQAIREGAKATLEVDKQLVELNTYLGQSRKELEGFSQSLFKVAKNAAVPFEAASEAAKEFARQGLSANEILKRTESALTLARISGISYSQAVNGITTALNSFSKEALTASEITNKLIAVDTRFAVSSAQLNEALTRVGSSAEESGISIDKLIATVTAAQQITGRGGAVIGNALKTIFTRLQRPEVLSQLEQLGVAIKDQNGFLLDGISILKNYSDATKNLSQAEKARTAELVGGIYQINQVNALIKDLSSSNSIYANALKISSAATDEAKKKNEELNKSLSALLEQTKTSAQQAAAALGQSLLEPIVKLGSAASEALLKIVDPNSVGEEMGAAIAKGAASALGRGLVMGGGPLLAATGGLLAAKMFKYVSASAKELGRFSTDMFTSEKELQIQKRINDTLRQSPGIIADVRSGKMSLVDAETEVLRLIQEQNRNLLTQSRITGRVTSTVTTAQNASKKGFFGRIFADGYVPDLSSSVGLAALEENTARRMGAKNPKARMVQATIKGKTGPVMVNDQEKVIPNYAGTGETAIIPNYRKFNDIPRMSKGYVPNFAFDSLKTWYTRDRKIVDPETYSYLRYALTKDKKAINLVFSKSEQKGQGWQMFERLGKTAKRIGLPVKSDVLSSQANDVLDISDASLAKAGKYGIEEVLKVAYPQLIYRQKGSSKGTSLSVNLDNGLNNTSTELSGKNIFSIVSEFASKQYKGDSKLLRNSIIDGSFDLQNIVTNFAGGRIPNFAKKDRYKFPSISSAKMEANIGRNFEKLSPENQRYFARAYEDYNNLIKVFSKASGSSPEKFANVMSALSPANPLERNALDALRYNLYTQKKLSTIASPIFLDEREIGSVKAQTYGANRTKAANLLVGLEKLTGNKRKAFLNNMLDPFGSTDVTVDYRAQGDALGKSFNVKNAPSMNREQYDKVSQAFRNVGAKAGVSGLGVQAATWIGQRMNTKAAKGQDLNRGILKFFYDNPDKISLENLEFLLSVPAKGKARKQFFKTASAMGVSKLSPDSLITIPRAAGGYIPNFAGLSNAISREKTMSGLPASQIMAHFDGKGNPLAVTNKRDEPRGLQDVPNFAIPRSLLKRFAQFKRGTFGNPISASLEVLQGSFLSSIVDQLAEAEKISAEASALTTGGVPTAYGLKNIGRGIFGKGSSLQKGFSIASGLGQVAYGIGVGSQAGDDVRRRINEKRYEEALDRSRKTYQDLTENTLELSNTLAKLDAAYRDPKADPKQITKLAKIREDLINKVSLKNPELVSKLASEQSIEGKINILEENTKESQRQQSIREQALKFSARGAISGKEAPKEIGDFFASIINAGNENILKQDLSKATTANFGDVLKAGGLNVEELSNVFKTDDLKKAFIDALKVTQKLSELSTRQERDITALSRPLAVQQQRVADAKEVRGEIRKALQEQLPELASFAGTFSKRAGLSASSDAALAIKRTDAAVSFQNSLLAQLSDKEFAKGLPSEVESRLRNIDAPGKAAAKELETLKSLPGLSEKQIEGLDKLIGFNSQQARSVEKATIIANETKNIQLKFLALQEKLAFGGDIRTSINPQMRNEAMAAGIRGPLTYQLGGLLGSRRTQVGGAVDFLTDTIQKYPGLLQTKGGKEPMDIQAVKRELTGINAMDMQRDLLKRAGMAQMMGLGQTSGLLRSKAFDQGYLMESAGLKASALFGGPEVPEEIKNAMGEYERFNVQSARQSRAEDAALKTVEDFFVPLKQKITDQFTTEGNQLAKSFQESLKTTFGDKGIIASIVNVTTEKINSIGSSGNTATTPVVQNFANPINDAVTREKMALGRRGIIGVPNFAMASINLERSPDLVTSSNPQGFGVTNSIDEKNGLRSLGMRSSGFVPNFAKSRMEELLERIYGPRADAPKPVVPSPPAPILGVSQKTMPFYPERLVNETYPYGSKPSIGNVNPTAKPQKSLPKRDPKTGRFLSKSQSDLMEKIEQGKLAKAAKKAQLAQGSPSGFSSLLAKPGLQQMLALTPEEQARIRRGAFESSQRAGAAQMAEYQRVFLAQKASELQPSAASRGLNILPKGQFPTPLFSGKNVSPLGLLPRGQGTFKGQAFVPNARVASGPLSLQSKSGITSPSLRLSNYRAASAGTGSYLDAFLVGNEENFKIAAENERQAAANRYFQKTEPLRQAQREQSLKQVAQAAENAKKGQRVNISEIAKRFDARSSTKAGRIDLTEIARRARENAPSNFKEYTSEEVKNILSKKPSTPSASIVTPKTSGILGKVKSSAGIGLKGLGILGGVAEAYDAYANIQAGNYGKAALSGVSSALSFGSLLGGTVGAAAGGAGLVLAAGVGGYKLGNIIEEKIGLGEAMGNLFSGSATSMARQAGKRNLREMSSREAYDSDQIIYRKMQLLNEANRYNRASGNPALSFESGLARAKAAQERKDEQDIATLRGNLDKESEATRAAIAARAAGAGAAETARLNKQSAAEEDARSSPLRRSFLESFDKNAESAGYLTTQDKVNFLLGQEGKNGLGSFKSTDFADPEFARSFNTYKEARNRFAATEAPTTLEFKSMQSQARTGFSDDVLREAVARGVSAETIEEERARKQAAAQGAIPNFAAMSNSMMSSGDVYSRMRATSARSSMGSYSGGYIPNFAAGDFTNAITEALRNGITSAFPDGPSSSSVSNSNVINIDGRTSIQNAPDEAMQGIISILFDKIPELKKLGPAALNFKR
jgi:TP901 family phage tail tape measure protein